MKLYTDLEQSKKLTKILSEESADHFHFISHIHTDGPLYEMIRPISEVDDISKYWPCWSLAALIDALPEIQSSKPAILLNSNSIVYPHVSGLSAKADNLVDACVEMIINLHEKGLLKIKVTNTACNLFEDCDK